MLIISFSGNAENSLTLKSLEVLEHHPDVTEEFEKLLVKPSAKIGDDEWFSGIRAKMEAADIIIWAVSPYHMNMPSHMLRFFDRCRKEGVMLESVNTFFQTNVRVCDHFLTESLERNIRTICKHYVTGLSYGSYDMINREMQLYLITVPDKPEAAKKGLFKKGGDSPAEFKDGEGIKNAVAWYKMLKGYSEYFAGRKQKLYTGSPKKVLFVNMMNKDEEVSESTAGKVKKLKELYSENGMNVSEIAQRDFKIHTCDGCKICYASKVCKFKDDFQKYEKELADSDIMIYYGRCEYGGTGWLSKKFIDRSVHRGLMPNDGVIPKELKKFRSQGYIVDCEDPQSYFALNEYNFGLVSFSVEHYLGVCADGMTDSPTVEEMGIYSLMLYEYALLPQRNFYSEKIGKHFSDLSQSIAPIIPDEGKYYKKCGAYDPVPIEENARPAMPETYKMGAQMRLTPYNKVIESLDRRKKSGSGKNAG